LKRGRAPSTGGGSTGTSSRGAGNYAGSISTECILIVNSENPTSARFAAVSYRIIYGEFCNAVVKRGCRENPVAA
jgi:hypothetical protein